MKTREDLEAAMTSRDSNRSGAGPPLNGGIADKDEGSRSLRNWVRSSASVGFSAPVWRPLSAPPVPLSKVQMKETVPNSREPVFTRFAVAGKVRYRMRVSYDGTEYSGWQLQGEQRTIQGELEHCIARRTQSLVRVVGASRTDAGVHARGQMAHIDIPMESAPQDLAKFEFTLNRMLPADIRVRQVETAPAKFCETDRDEEHVGKPWHAIYRAKSKLYAYRISTGLTHDPLERLYRHHEWRSAQLGFDAEAFRRTVAVFVGTHDFSSFTNTAPGQVKDNFNPLLHNPVRTVKSATVIEEGNGRFRVDFVLNGALYRMVRNMVGAALEVACGLLTVEDVVTILQARNRRIAPRTAPACGLCLEHVFYDE